VVLVEIGELGHAVENAQQALTLFEQCGDARAKTVMDQITIWRDNSDDSDASHA